MKRLLLAACSALLLLSTSAMANHHGRGHDNDHDQGQDRGHHDNGLHRGWNKCERLPEIYLQPRYYVTDYRVYHLAAPRPGYHWVRVPDGRFLLVAAATGVIADILLGH